MNLLLVFSLCDPDFPNDTEIPLLLSIALGFPEMDAFFLHFRFNMFNILLTELCMAKKADHGDTTIAMD